MVFSAASLLFVASAAGAETHEARTKTAPSRVGDEGSAPTPLEPGTTRPPWVLLSRTFGTQAAVLGRGSESSFDPAESRSGTAALASRVATLRSCRGGLGVPQVAQRTSGLIPRPAGDLSCRPGPRSIFVRWAWLTN